MLLFKSCVIGTIRGFCTKVDKPILSKLRKKTGFPIINCKNALVKFDNNFEKAEEWLQEQAQKEGWARATKLQSRPMSQGLIGLVGDQKSATMIEVNCETDFVGRNMKFVELVSNLLKSCSNHCNNITANTLELDKEVVNSIVTPDGKTLRDMVAYNVGSIGENMAIRRAVHVVASPQSQLYSYVHVSDADIKPPEGFANYQVGKYGTIVEIQQGADGNNSEDDLAIKNGICQHIVGMNPKTIGELDDEMPSQGDNEERLLFQEYLLDSSVLVKDVVKDNDLEVVDFVRFECGEVLPGDEG